MKLQGVIVGLNKKLFIISIIFILCIAASVAISVTITKGLIGKQDLSLWNGTSTKTFTRETDEGYSYTLNQFDWVGVDVLQKFGGGVSRTLATINSALGTVGAVNKVALWFSPGVWNITDNLTITSNITMVVPAGVTFSITSGKTLTIQGPIEAGPYLIFSGSGTVNYSTAPGIHRREWVSDAINDGLVVTGYFQLDDQVNAVNEISNDPYLSDNSQTAIPTEYAVKSYTDSVVREGYLLRPKFIWTETLYFNSGGTTEIVAGNTIVGATSGATAVVELVDLDSGAWGDGDAEGVLFLTQASATAFQSENLNISGGASNVATILGDTSHNGVVMTPGRYQLVTGGTPYGVVQWNTKLGFEFGSGGSNSNSDDLGASEWHVLFIDASAIVTLGSSYITEEEFINTNEVSSWGSIYGYYPSAAGSYVTIYDRAIFAVLTDGSNNIIPFDNDGGDYVQYQQSIIDVNDQDVDNAWVDASTALSMPSFSIKAEVSLIWENATTDNWIVHARKNGSSVDLGSGSLILDCGTVAANTRNKIRGIIYTDSSHLLEFWSSTSAADMIDVQTHGWFLPAGM